jgi:SAM-dependent methyltransferase
VSLDPFANFVRFYDLDEGRFTDDLGLYRWLADEWPGSILELGCGTGRVVAALAQVGHQVTGLDSSAAMLQAAEARLARTRPAGLVQLVAADMRDFTLPSRFAWALCALNSLMHLITLEDQLAALEATRRHLQPEGHLLLDLTNPDPSWLLEPGERIVRVGVLDDSETGHTVVRQVLQHIDPLAQTLHLTYMYDEIGAEGVVHRAICPLRLRYLFPSEARLLLERAGFEVEQIYGSYDLEPFDGTTERMIFACRAR